MLKSTRPPARSTPAGAPGEERELTRCVRRSYRLGAGAPRASRVLLWVSGRDRPGVHAVGTVAGPGRRPDDDAGPVLPVRLTLLPEPFHRAELLADPGIRYAEVLRMPAGQQPVMAVGRAVRRGARAGRPHRPGTMGP